MQRPDSPCTGICTLDDDEQCLGCHRSLDEIVEWDDLDAQAQWDVVAQLPMRATKVGGD
ncbi:MAG: DUF1289 domain-containing protein [Gammaproteobacteria bacterium]|nr:DUF1289 domain-containing protein [Gammaproteobacteria bacterium]